MISALTLFQTEDSAIERLRWSYIDLAEELRRVSSRPKEDAHELFRLMAFNALVSNIDDHPRNHALIARKAGLSNRDCDAIRPSYVYPGFFYPLE